MGRTIRATGETVAITIIAICISVFMSVSQAAAATTLTLEAYEQAGGSCPWVYVWDGEEFAQDNDVYSTARGAGSEYRDYYLLSKPLMPVNGGYSLELRETEKEISYTDLIELYSIDHAADVKIGTDDNGSVWTYRDPSAPVSAVDQNGGDVLSQITTADDAGVKGYHNNYFILDFSNLDTTNGATLVFRSKGFLDDGDPGAVIPGKPYIYIQTQDSNGEWVTRNIYYPRFEWALTAYNLKDYLTYSRKVRIYITSCNERKYHLIDYIGLDTSPQEPVTVDRLNLTSAIHSANGVVLSQLQSADNNYVVTRPGERISLVFDMPGTTEGLVRDFMFVSEGYYEISQQIGTYYIYTWDGVDWQQRAFDSFAGSEQTKQFDLSSWLPDADGEYKVRIFQSYSFSSASVDYVGLDIDGVFSPMVSATNLQDSSDVINELIASDDVRVNFSESGGRWLEIQWAAPDLVVSYLSGSAASYYGSITRVNVHCSIMNQGDRSAAASRVNFYLSRDTTFSGDDKYLGGVDAPAIAGGSEFQVQYLRTTYNLPPGTSANGIWYILGVADANNAVSELSETNNVRAELLSFPTSRR